MLTCPSCMNDTINASTSLRNPMVPMSTSTTHVWLRRNNSIDHLPGCDLILFRGRMTLHLKVAYWSENIAISWEKMKHLNVRRILMFGSPGAKDINLQERCYNNKENQCSQLKIKLLNENNEGTTKPTLKLQPQYPTSSIHHRNTWLGCHISPKQSSSTTSPQWKISWKQGRFSLLWYFELSLL